MGEGDGDKKVLYIESTLFLILHEEHASELFIILTSLSSLFYMQQFLAASKLNEFLCI
jgi:hypothetical protein